MHHDSAEGLSLCRRALEVGPDDVTSLCNYAGFLKNAKNDAAKAEEYIVRARGIDRAMADRLIQAHVRTSSRIDLVFWST